MGVVYCFCGFCVFFLILAQSAGASYEASAGKFGLSFLTVTHCRSHFFDFFEGFSHIESEF